MTSQHSNGGALTPTNITIKIDWQTQHKRERKKAPDSVVSRSCYSSSRTGRSNSLTPNATIKLNCSVVQISGVPRNFVRGGVQQIRLRTEDRKNGYLGAVAPLVRSSGGSCNLIQEISFHVVKFS